MVNWKIYKTPIIILVITIIALGLLLAFGFTLGIISNNPDGLERVLEDFGVGELHDFWYPIFAWIENEYIAGILGIVLSMIIIGGVFYLLSFFKHKHSTEK
jgi:hypothetical protein